MTEKEPITPDELLVQLQTVIDTAGPLRRQRRTRYDRGRVFELELTGVCPAGRAKAVMTVEALWDRQQAKQLPGHDTEFAVLSEYIEHALGDIEKLAKRDGLWSKDSRLVRFQFVYRGKAGERDIHIEIDPRASHGYLYSCVWV